jgi:hypothetical protein
MNYCCAIMVLGDHLLQSVVALETNVNLPGLIPE